MEHLSVLNAGGCGVSVVSGLSTHPVDMFSITKKDGTYAQLPFKEAVLAGHKRLWTSYDHVKVPGAVCIWADVASSNGERIYKKLLAEGEVVDKIECGKNPMHGEAQICVYFWYTTPEGRKLHPKPTIRTIEVEQEQEPVAKKPIDDEVARIRQLRAASGGGVRASGARRPFRRSVR